MFIQVDIGAGAQKVVSVHCRWQTILLAISFNIIQQSSLVFAAHGVTQFSIRFANSSVIASANKLVIASSTLPHETP